MVPGRRQALLARRCLILALPALLIPSRADALDPAKAVADYSVTSWRETEGLLTAVTAITQDTTGYLWVGGENGLFRFDGARFVRRPLASLRVNALCAARDGSVWVALTEGNVVRLLQEQATVFSVRDELPLATVTDLLCDRAGTVGGGASTAHRRMSDGQWRRSGG